MTEITTNSFTRSFFAHAPARLAASALSGILMVLIFPKPEVPFLVWVACVPLLLAVLSEQRLGFTFLWGLVTGAVFLAGSLDWFVAVMENYGQVPLWQALGIMALFLALFSPFWAVWGLIEACVARRSLAHGLLLAPFLWVAMELARTYLITGFPWNLLGYAVEAPGLDQLASSTGVYGVSFLAIATSSFFCWVLLQPRLPAAKWVTVAWLVALLAADMALAPPRALKPDRLAVLVQPDVPLNDAAVRQWAPWRNPEPLENLVNLSVQSVQANLRGAKGAPLIVWSESSAPFFFDRDPAFRGAVETMAREAHADVVANTITFVNGDTMKPQNTAVALNPSGSVILEYHKIHLVPMGEYVPGWLRFTQMSKVTSEVGDFIPGGAYSTASTGDGSLGIFICYEAIFPQLVRRLVPPGAGVLVNISDDAWYGTSAARFQHLNMARFRAIENHRYLLRSTDDGVTAVVDPYGRVVSTAPLYCQAALAARFSFLARRTFYTEHGDVFAWSCVVICVIIIAAGLVVRRSHGIMNAE